MTSSKVISHESMLGTRPEEWRLHFPVLERRPGDPAYIYLDSAATVHRPNAVIDAVSEYYRTDNANPGRTLHLMARRSDERYEGARRTVARFIGAADPLEVVFVRGTSEAINLVAATWGDANVRVGDEIVLTVAEHYSNLIPWQLLARRSGAVLRFVDVDDDGSVRLDELDGAVSQRTKLVAVSHVSNVLGAINPVKDIAAIARRVGARVLVDGAQSIPHLPIDVNDIGCDFFAFSGHKMLGPMGIGALWARRELLEEMMPYHSGGDMARAVTREGAEFAAGAERFEAGTPNVAGAVGLEAAFEFIEAIGYGAIRKHELQLTRRALDGLTEIRGIRLLGSSRAEDRVPLFAFVVRGREAGELVSALDARGMGIRDGELSALLLLTRLGTQSALRASLYLYNTLDEVDRFLDVLADLSAIHPAEAH